MDNDALIQSKADLALIWNNHINKDNSWPRIYEKM